MNFLNNYLKFLGINKKAYQKILKSKDIKFDLDGDRVFFKEIKPDLIAALLAQDLLKRHKKAKIIIDARCSKVLAETIKKNGGKVIFSKVGHAFFKRAMAKHRAVFGAELSGHYYFKEFFNCDNGLLAAIKVLNIVKKSGKKLDDLIKPFKKYFQSKELNFKVKNKEKVLRILERKFKKGKINKLDGLSVEYKDWWFNLRSSNTEPVTRLNIEARTPKLLQEKQQLLTKLFKNVSF